MSKAILLNDGGYVGMDFVDFPVEVSISNSNRYAVAINVSELERIGCDMHEFDDDDEWWFLREDLELVKNK